MALKKINWKRVVFGEKTKEEKKKRFWKIVKSNLIEFAIALLLVCIMFGSRCASSQGLFNKEELASQISQGFLDETSESSVGNSVFVSESDAAAETSSPLRSYSVTSVPGVDLDDLPDDIYAIEINGGVPFFTDDEIQMESSIQFTGKDALNRTGPATACLSSDLLPSGERDEEALAGLAPSGWQAIKADDVDNGWLYNRCHLIGWLFAGDATNDGMNLITGTRQLNIEGMLPQEIAVVNVIEDNPGIHVMYRVTPVYVGDELVARGVIMEALSVEDNGTAVRFCFFIPNTQQGYVIDYATGNAQKKS